MKKRKSGKKAKAQYPAGKSDIDHGIAADRNAAFFMAGKEKYE